MIEKFRAWIADSKERKRAMIISAVSMLLILFIVSAQDFLPPPESKTAMMEKKTFPIPPKPQNEATLVQPKVSKPATPARPAVITPATPTREVQKTVKGNYYVQVAAFRDAKRAQTQIRKLQKMGWNTALNKKKNGIHAVWAGPWSTLKQAKKAQEKLKRETKIKGFIVKKK